MSANSIDLAKRQAAARAAELVRPGMRLGLGTGSTAKYFVEQVAEKIRQGMSLTCVPTSESTHALAQSLGVLLSTLDQTPELDLTVDGADEFDARLNLIKGGGGALLREKIVANASGRLVVIVDRSKQAATLGRFPLPIEVTPFGLEATRRLISRAAAEIGCVGPIDPRRTSDGAIFVTDGGHYILDCAFGAIEDPPALARRLDGITGVMEHGLFIGLASAVIVADSHGVEIIGDLG